MKQSTTNEQFVYKRLVETWGFTPQQAAGIVGNLYVESGGSFNPKIIQDLENDDLHSSETPIANRGFGIAQWTITSRQLELIGFAASQKKPVTDLGVQVDFIVKELCDNPNYGLGDLQAAKTPEEAAIVFLNQYESPKDVQGNIEKRTKLAGHYYDTYGGSAKKPDIPTLAPVVRTGKSDALIGTQKFKGDASAPRTSQPQIAGEAPVEDGEKVFGTLKSANVTYKEPQVENGTGEYEGALVSKATGAPVMSLTGSGPISATHDGVDIGTVSAGNHDNVITESEGAKPGTVVIISGGYVPDGEGGVEAAPVASVWAAPEAGHQNYTSPTTGETTNYIDYSVPV